MKKKILAYVISIVSLLSASSCVKAAENISWEEDNSIIESQEDNQNVAKSNEKEELVDDDLLIIAEEVPEPIKSSITISAVGDCTLGRDDRGDYYYSLPYFLEVNNNDYSYFFKGVYDILNKDDLTIANLESPLTDATVRAQKKFTFKGPSDYTNILINGSVEAVNLANNHTYDYLEAGYNDTLNTLKESPLLYFGNGIYSIKEINGKKIGMCGIQGWSQESACADIDAASLYFAENNCDLKIYTFHWGIEREYQQNYIQENIAHYAIDKGADLVLGHHPHVLQGIEEYNGKYIVYSLGNFVFGGNKNPGDKDTMIFQITFNYEDGILTEPLVNIIPASLSSTNAYNDYQPQILDGDEKARVLKKILNSSTNFTYED